MLRVWAIREKWMALKFTKLPIEICCLIVELLDLETYLNFSLVCRRAKEIAKMVEFKQKKKSLRLTMRSVKAFFGVHEYFTLPNSDMLETPKYNFPQEYPADFTETDTLITIETQLLSLFHTNCSQTSEEQKRNEDFMTTYWWKMAPVELLWAMWNFLEYQLAANPQSFLPIRYAEFIESWMGKNYNNEWNGCLSSAPYHLYDQTKPKELCKLFHRNLLYKEMKRINKQYETICIEGAIRIKAACKTLKDKLARNVKREQIYTQKPPANPQKTILDFSIEEIVQQNALINYFDLVGTTPSEFGAIIESEERNGITAPHLFPLIERYKFICNKLGYIVLQAETKELRALLILRICDIAIYCLTQSKILDYNLALAFTSGLDNSAIHRMAQTTASLWDLCPNALNGPYDTLRALFCNERSFRNLKEYMAANQAKPHVPPLNIPLNEYASITASNANSGSPLINITTQSTIAQLGNTLKKRLSASESTVNIILENKIDWEFSDWFLFPSIPNFEENNFRRSLQLEPRGHAKCQSTNPIRAFPLENVLLVTNEQEAQLVEMLNPFTKSLGKKTTASKDQPVTLLVPFLVTNFYHLQSREISEEENKFPDFRLNIVISIQFRILIILKKNKNRIVSSPLQELVDNLWKSIEHESCFSLVAGKDSRTILDPLAPLPRDF